MEQLLQVEVLAGIVLGVLVVELVSRCILHGQLRSCRKAVRQIEQLQRQSLRTTLTEGRTGCDPVEKKNQMEQDMEYLWSCLREMAAAHDGETTKQGDSPQKPTDEEVLEEVLSQYFDS